MVRFANLVLRHNQAALLRRLRVLSADRSPHLIAAKALP